MAQLPIAQYQLPFKAPGAPAERKALHYFFVHASVELSTYLALGFWDGWLLQLCQTDTTVQQAVIALSRAHLERSKTLSLLPPRSMDHRDLSTSQSFDGYFTASAETLEAYQRAVRRLIYSMRKQPRPPHSMVLTCCILLYTFSGLIGDPVHAEVHLSNGVHIFREMLDAKSTTVFKPSHKQLPRSTTTNEELDALLPVIARLDLELAHYSQGDMWLVLESDAYDLKGQHEFSSVQDAALLLNRLFRALKRLMEEAKRFVKRNILTAPMEMVASATRLTSAFENWQERIVAYEQKDRKSVV